MVWFPHERGGFIGLGLLLAAWQSGWEGRPGKRKTPHTYKWDVQERGTEQTHKTKQLKNLKDTRHQCQYYAVALVLCIHDVSTSLNYLTRYDGRSRILKLLPFFREGLWTVSRSTDLLNSLLSMQLTACMGLPLHYMQFTCTTLRCGHKFEWQGDSESHFTTTEATLCVACCSSDSWESDTGWSGP